MSTGERFAQDEGGPTFALARCAALAAVIYVLAAFVSSDRARGDCFSDVAHAIVNTASALDSPECQSAFSESSLVTTGLTAVFEADPSFANQACNAINDAKSWLPPQLLSELGPLDPTDFAVCACSMYQGIGQLPNEAVQCIQGFICGVSELVGLGNPCQTCQQPPPVPANCTPSAACINVQNDPSLQSTCNNLLEYNTAGPNQGYFPLQTKLEPDGSTIIITGIDTGHLTTCSPGEYCICPSPMKFVPVKEYDPSGNSTWYYATCQCPTAADRNNDPTQGTKPLNPSGPLAYVCICDETGLPAVPPDWGQPKFPGGNNLNPTHSICPTPLTGVPCPVAGQIRVSNNKCVEPCTKSGEVMTPDGVCCDPNNVAACGQCCGNGMVPDPANGTCMPEQIAQ